MIDNSTGSQRSILTRTARRLITRSSRWTASELILVELKARRCCGRIVS
jgi:hypothetical protein